MKVGDLVAIFNPKHPESIGFGIYLGPGSRGTMRLFDEFLYAFWFNGRVATFDSPYWEFEVII